jgi:hypothetical protein
LGEVGLVEAGVTGEVATPDLAKPGIDLLSGHSIADAPAPLVCPNPAARACRSDGDPVRSNLERYFIARRDAECVPNFARYRDLTLTRDSCPKLLHYSYSLLHYSRIPDVFRTNVGVLY